MAYPLRVTGLARELKTKCGKYPVNGCRVEWYVIARMVIVGWNDTYANDTKYCNISDQLQGMSLAKGTEAELQRAIRKAKI